MITIIIPAWPIWLFVTVFIIQAILNTLMVVAQRKARLATRDLIDKLFQMRTGQ